ncbi:methyltransferase [Virgisporangium aliadipatigenens]|uniref:Methyltransferase n=1 Tax=Virgisporangium aliadipatigenens TaxID=741659 RepID=A0A8J3YRI7_9ACTN|nr:methyltransferase domain-containing protein [Virgisporangium aliadipatigenens]GIJ49068.1 methyltransferase [Virgisporangium aliadipatigenens]
MSRTTYMFDNRTPEAQKQLGFLAGILDAHSFEVLAGLDIAPGSRCLDIGPGAGTVTRWLADAVGDTGRVVALDVEPQHVPAGGVIEVRQGDVRVVDLDPEGFDLIHARLVLMHIPERVEVLRRLVAALRPGGRIVLSEWDCTELDRMLVHATDPAAFDAVTAFQRALIAHGESHGMSPTWAREVPAAMAAAGLPDVEATVFNKLWAGGEPGCLLHASNSHQREAALLAQGATTEQLETLRAAMVDPATLAWSYLMYTTVGRRPA